MRTEHVENLRSPLTGAVLHLVSDDKLSGRLLSEDGREQYLVSGGIPRFFDLAKTESDQAQTIDSFSFKWSKIPTYAHGESTKRNREAWYLERFGFFDEAGLARSLRGARRLLEAGTGTGVDTDLLTRNSSGTLYGVDASGAIDHAFERFRHEPRVCLLQGDIGALPFEEDFFDVISCDQVLHHTPDPRAVFAHLVRHLRVGGRLLLYVYRRKGALREFADDHLRSMFTQGPEDACVDVSERLARLGRNLSRLKATVEVEDDFPELGLNRGIYDVQRLIYDHVLKCFWNDDYDFETNAMVNFDWYRPVHAFRYTVEEIRTWCQEERMSIQHENVSPAGISIIAQREATQ
jgi:SAM-dependent methyltransferase